MRLNTQAWRVLMLVCVVVASVTSRHTQAQTSLRLQVVSGQGQTASAGQPFPQRLVVRLTDAQGAPFVGAPIQFGPQGCVGGFPSSCPYTGSPGHFADGSDGAVVATDASGTATAPIYIAGTTPGKIGVYAYPVPLVPPHYFGYSPVLNSMVGFTFDVSPIPVDELSVVPSAPQPGDSVAIQVPGLACYNSQPVPRMDTVTVNVGAMTIDIEARQDGWSCFAAGDPLVDKSYKVEVGVLAAGSYCVNYTRRMSGAINMTRQLAFAVGIPFTPSSTCQPRRAMLGNAVEYFHAVFEHYFVTNDPIEVEMLDTGAFQGWQRTGQSFNVFPTRVSGTAPVIRYFSEAFAPKSTHFYTLRAINFAATLEPSWQYEGEPFYMMSPSVDGVCPAATVPIYRYYNKSKGGTPNHRFVADRSVHEAMLAAGWIAEGFGSGVAMCGPAVQGAVAWPD